MEPVVGALFQQGNMVPFAPNDERNAPGPNRFHLLIAGTDVKSRGTRIMHRATGRPWFVQFLLQSAG